MTQTEWTKSPSFSQWTRTARLQWSTSRTLPESTPDSKSLNPPSTQTSVTPVFLATVLLKHINSLIKSRLLRIWKDFESTNKWFYRHFLLKFTWLLSRSVFLSLRAPLLTSSGHLSKLQFKSQVSSHEPVWKTWKWCFVGQYSCLAQVQIAAILRAGDSISEMRILKCVILERLTINTLLLCV